MPLCLHCGYELAGNPSDSQLLCSHGNCRHLSSCSSLTRSSCPKCKCVISWSLLLLERLGHCLLTNLNAMLSLLLLKWLFCHETSPDVPAGSFSSSCPIFITCNPYISIVTNMDLGLSRPRLTELVQYQDTRCQRLFSRICELKKKIESGR